MSWNDGEVTVVPVELKKPAGADDFWQQKWRANYKGREFNIRKSPKGHYAHGSGYEVHYLWKGGHPKNYIAILNPHLIGLNKWKTMPQVKKFIRIFVDDMNDGKLVDTNTGETLSFTTFDICTSCSVYDKYKIENTNLHHRRNMAHHKILQVGQNVPHYYCKYHTKMKVLEEQGRLPEGRKKIDVDALVPDSELILMHNPYLQMARRRRGLEAEGITTNPLLWAGATVLTLLTLFKHS